MILITGGAGYIGSHTSKLLFALKREVIVFDNLITGHREFCKWGELIEGDLGDLDRIRWVFKNRKIDAVIHLAASSYIGESVSDPEKYYYNNFIHTLNLLKVMREFAVDKIIFSSTCATYGIPSYTPIAETHPQNPINPYGRSKFMVESILEDYSNAYGLKYVCLRYFNVAGADTDSEIGEWHEPETRLIPLIYEVAMGKMIELKVFGKDYATPDGTCIRDYIHVLDLAEAHILALNYIEKNNSSIKLNLSNGSGFSVLEVIKTFEKVSGKNLIITYVNRRPGDPPILVGDSTLAKVTLGWQPRFADLEIILETGWKWHRKMFK